MLPSADAVEYTESAPPPQLASIVRCVWRLDGHARDLNDAIQPVLPDGCPELVVHLGDAFERVHPHGLVGRQPAVLVAGQLTRQLSLRATGRIAVAGVRFHPDGAAALLRVPQHQLAGLTVGVDEVAGPLSRSLRDVRDSTESTSALSPSNASWSTRLPRASMCGFAAPSRSSAASADAFRSIAWPVTSV